MDSVSVTLPPSLKDYLDDQVRQGGYDTPSEYISDLVRDDQQRKAQAKLEALLLEGINSGEPIEANAGYWARKRSLLIERHSEKTGIR